MSARLQELARHAMSLKIANYARDGWTWFGEQVRTFDEHDKKQPVKAFPTHKEYLWTSYCLWLDEDWTIWEKTRQLMYSWLFSGAHLHLAMFTPYRRVMLASKTEDDAIALLDRHEFIYNNQGDPDEFPDGVLPKTEDRKPGDCAIKRAYPAVRVGNELQFANGSVIVAIPRGKHKIRSFVCSALFADEFGFMEDGEEMFGAAIPALTGGGKFTGVSSANIGHMESIVTTAKKHASRKVNLMPGLDVWTSKASETGVRMDATGFTVVRAHYSADPDPYLQAKVREARALYESTGRLAFFNKEYEIVYDALSGELIYPHFDEKLHVIPPISMEQIADWKKIRIIDPGWRNACAVVWIAVSPLGWRGCVYTDIETGVQYPLPVFVVYREFHESKMDVKDIISVVKLMSGTEKYEIDLIDPSADITKGNEDAGLNTLQQFIHGGIPVIKANNTVATGLDQVRRRFGVYGQSPALLICSNCEVTIKQHQRYRYKDVSPQVAMNADAPEVPRKKDDHTCDCVRYGCQWNPLPEKGGRVVVPNGSFAHAVQTTTKSATTWASMKW